MHKQNVDFVYFLFFSLDLRIMVRNKTLRLHYNLKLKKKKKKKKKASYSLNRLFTANYIICLSLKSNHFFTFSFILHV